MINVSITAKNRRKYTFSVAHGADFLSTLDKFLKRNKLDLLSLEKIEVNCGAHGESVGCRAARSAARAIEFARKRNK